MASFIHSTLRSYSLLICSTFSPLWYMEYNTAVVTLVPSMTGCPNWWCGSTTIFDCLPAGYNRSATPSLSKTNFSLAKASTNALILSCLVPSVLTNSFLMNILAILTPYEIGSSSLLVVPMFERLCTGRRGRQSALHV